MTWKYEYKSDLDNEVRIMDRLSGMWNCEAEKLPGYNYADYFLTRGYRDGRPQAVALCELRVRSTPRFKYDTVFVTLNKYQNMLQMAEFTGLKPMFVVEWSDECAYIELTKDNAGVSYPKRSNPKGSDHLDELCVHLDVAKFTTLWSVGS
jgi:hypothetical protein|tara:strand:+ start:239 stop:688 length:450 start_codon:yes stop_codon:yes gene_type:complete